ncbi:Rhomboid domain-containing protein 2 [Blastocladiella emersonii ATCC 22665]|nr:Rhomboid domain-containing protein 2 [Blastocladiella emersonii ATCC 22665]
MPGIQLPTIGRNELRHWLDVVPLGTRAYAVAVWALYLLTLLTGHSAAVSGLCYNPSSLFSLAVYRIWLAPLMHGGLLHILFNTIALLSLGTQVEKRRGTLTTLFAMLVVLPFVSAVAHWFLHGLLYLVGLTGPECAVGASGVLFALMAAFALGHHEAEPSSTFGQSRAWPVLIVLVLSSLLFPSASWQDAKGMLDVVLLPASVVDRIETSTAPAVRRIVDSDIFIPHDPSTALPRYTSVGANGAVEADGRGLMLSDDEEGLIPASPGAPQTLFSAPSPLLEPARSPSPGPNSVGSSSSSEGGASPLIIPAEPKLLI